MMVTFPRWRRWWQREPKIQARKSKRRELGVEMLEDRKLMTVTPALGSGKEIFVAPTGDDWNNGSLAQPFHTIRRALDAAAPGDVITLRNGVYDGNVTVDINSLTIRSMPGEWAVVESPYTQFDDGRPASVFRFDYNTDGGKLQNLEIVGGYWYGVMFGDWWDSTTGPGTVHQGASEIILDGCKIHDTGVDAVKITPGANDISILNCEIYNTGRRSTTSADGIDNNNGDRMHAQGNYVHHTVGVGILTTGGSVQSVIEQNLVKDTGGAGINVGFYSDLEWMEPGSNPNLYTSIDNIARNNIIVHPAHAGIGIYASQNPQVYNNTIVNAADVAQAPIQFAGVDIWVSNALPDQHVASVNPMVENNVISISNESRMIDIRQGSYTGALTLDYNLYYTTGLLGPRFIDRNLAGDGTPERTFSQWKNIEGHDQHGLIANPQLDASWHLVAGSPAIAKAISLANLANDVDGNSRPGTADIGADQYGAGANKLLPPAPFGAPSIEIADRAYHDYEGKTINVHVVRRGQRSNTVTVHFGTMDGTAKAGLDYTGVSGVLTFAPGETENIVPVVLLTDSMPEGDEHFLFTLSNPTTDGTLPVTLGHQSAASMTIDDLDTPITLNYRTLFVAPNGSDVTGDGSAAQPWKSLQHAAENVGPGDYVIVKPGLYQGMYMTIDGKPDARITFHAEPGVVIDDPDPVLGKDGINLEGASYVTIEGFSVHDMPRAGLRSVLNEGVILRGNNSDHNTYWGILTGWSEHIIIENNVTSRSQEQHGIYFSNSADDAIVRDNIVWGNRDSGIQFNADASLPGDGVHSRNLIEGNVIYDNGTGGGAAINLDGVQDSVIRNNLLYNNHATGIVLYVHYAADSSTNNLVENNTVVGAPDSRYALLMWSGSSGNKIVNNILLSRNPLRGSMSVEADCLPALSDYNILENGFELNGYSGNFATWQQFSGGQDAHSFFATADDLFVDPANNDFHLKLGSPAIDAGNPAFSPLFDVYRHLRTANGPVDIGAFEAGSYTPSVQFDWSNYVGYETGGMAEITVTRTGSTEGTVTVDYSSTAGSATPGSDYAPVVGTLIFGPGETKKTFVVFIADDTAIENLETVGLQLSNPTLNGAPGGVMLGQADATLNIVSDDAWRPGKVEFDTKSITVDESVGQVTLTVRRVDGGSGPVSVNYATGLYVPPKTPTWYSFHTLPLYPTDNATPATAGDDYQTTMGTLNFADGEMTKTISIPIVDDAWYEGDEAFVVNLSNPTGGAELGSIPQAKVRINSDDVKLPGKFVFASSTYEVTEGTPTVSVVVQRQDGGNVESDVWLYDTAAGNGGTLGNAWSGADYGSIPQKLHFAPGETQKTLNIPITDDSYSEGDEAFSIQLYSPSNDATVGTPAKTYVTIHDNDSTFYFQPPNGAYNFSVDEAAGSAAIKVVRQGALNTAASVQIKTGEWGSAQAGSDFINVNSTVNFAPGEAYKMVYVPIVNDNLVEPQESFYVSMSNCVGAQQGSWTAGVTINDDDQTMQSGKFVFASAAYQVLENGGSIQVTVNRVDGTDGTATVKFTTNDGADGLAMAYNGYNYTKTAGTLTFGPGETSKTINIPIIDNSNVNPDKGFTVTLSSPGGGALLGAIKTTVVKILNDDSIIDFAGSSFDATEGDGWATLTFVRQGSTLATSSVNFTINTWSGDMWSRFEQPPELKVTFDVGESTKQFKLKIIDDVFRQGDEWFNLGLTNAQGSTLGYQYWSILKLHDND